MKCFCLCSLDATPEAALIIVKESKLSTTMPGKKKERFANMQKVSPVDWICDSCSKYCHKDLTCEEYAFKSKVEGYLNIHKETSEVEIIASNYCF